MTKKERIAELERKVAELEARPVSWQFPIYAPTVGTVYARCSYCGGSLAGGHNCPVWTVWNGNATVAVDDTNIRFIGATG